MKFKTTREALLKPLQVVSGVVEKRQTLPVLSNILVNVESDRLTLTGTDLEVELTAFSPLKNAEAGDITLPARKFMDICRTLPDEALIDITVDKDRALIRSGKSRFTLSTLPASEFPATDAIAGAYEFEVPQKDLKSLIDRTQFSMANQDVRYYLNGLLLEIDNMVLRAVATDGHRLAVSEMSQELPPTEKLQIIIPRKGVLELARMLNESDESCKVQIDTNHIKVTLSDIIFTSKLIDGRFPDYQRVIPQGSDKELIGDREKVRQALVRTAILSNEKYRGIRLQLEDNLLKAMVNNPELEEAEEEIDVTYSGEPLEIGFNVSYLVDALNAVLQDKVKIELSDANSSCLISGKDDDSTRYVVMPMRL